jgi:succinate-semialdehyde dehydrogenase / glutarate-semialdehyde dehydrogenase
MKSQPGCAWPLTDSSLLISQAMIDGRWVDACAGTTMATADPSDNEPIAQVPYMAQADTRLAIEAAERAFASWSKTTAFERRAFLERWCALIEANKEDLARLLTREQGKPLAEARGEIQIAADYVGWFAEEAVRAGGETFPSPWREARLSTLRQPVGVCAAITPWNFPSSMVTRKVAPALAAGCTIVLKPAERTPHSAFALAALAMRAGLPAGAFNVVTGNAREIGAEMCANPVVRKVSFTGSTPVGRLLMSQVAPTLKRISLELGGNAPFIVFDDADVEAAVQGAIASKYRNAGQTCVCANRFFIQRGIFDRFSQRFAEAVSGLVVGAGSDPHVQIGPLIDERALAKVEAHVHDAVAKGARVLTGGRPHPRGGTFYEPTVLAGAAPHMKVFSEEIFGPVSPLFCFDTEEEAILLANKSEHGLAAYFYTRDIGRVHRVSEALATGMVGVNTGMITTVAAPFGGVKQSGIGREGGTYGLDEFLDVKYVCTGGI